MDVRNVVPKDAIPSIDDPTFDPEHFGEADDEVIVLDDVEQRPRERANEEHGEPRDGARSQDDEDPPRAYPIRILSYHEIVNDVVDGRPVGVAWCPLCGSAVVYDRRHDGETLEFGVSGKLAADDLVMYDRETDSEWKQSSGECIAGPFEGASLSVLSATVLPWKTFRETYPDGTVLQPPGGESEAASDDDTPARIDYETSPYDTYFEMDGFGLDAHRGRGSREWNRNDLAPKTVVLGVETAEDALGFPLPRVSGAGGVVQTTVGDTPVVVFATDDGIHGYVDPGHEFEATDEGIVADGTTWDAATGRADDGRRLDRLPARRLFAFAWQDDHGPDAFYTGPE